MITDIDGSRVTAVEELASELSMVREASESLAEAIAAGAVSSPKAAPG